MTKIQVWKTFKLTLCNVWQNKLKWTRVLYAPWVVLLMGYLFVGLSYALTDTCFWLRDASTYKTMTFSQGVTVIAQIVIFYITAIIAGLFMVINGVRYALLQEGGNTWWTLPCNKRSIKLGGYALLIISSMALYVGLGAGIGWGLVFLPPLVNVITIAICGTVWVISFFYLITRISIYGLLIAIDKKQPLKTSWRLLKGNIWRIFWLTMLLSFIPTFGVFGILAAINATLHFIPLGITPLPFSVLSSLSGLLVTPLSAAILWKGMSLVYQTLDKEN